MITALMVTGTTLLISGIVMERRALSRHRSQRAPRMASARPRDWRLLWQTRDWFSDAAGFRLYVAGGVAWLTGLVLLLVSFLLQIQGQ